MGRNPTPGVAPLGEKRIQLYFQLQGRRCRPTLDLAPTQPNIRYAVRLVAGIRERIRQGTFDLGKEFPDYKGLHSFGVSAQVAQTFKQYADRWLKTKSKLSPSSQYGYEKILNANWLKWFDARQIASILPSEAEVFMAEATFGRKTYNNVLDVGRQVFEMALRDGAIKINPVAAVDYLQLQDVDPDPFTLAEVEQLLAGLRDRWGEEIADYYEWAFFTGLRPSEQIELGWGDCDLQARTATISRGKVRQTVKDTKTYNARTVELHSRAWAVLQRQKARTYLAGKAVFWNPHTGKAYLDERTQGRFFRAVLKLLGIRHRPAKNTRHTYATLLLMAGANSNWAAGQMGHSVQVFHTIYSKWLRTQDAGRELAKVEAYADAGSIPNGGIESVVENSSTGRCTGKGGGNGRL